MLPRFDRAWPGDHGERAIANLRTTDIDNRSVLFQIERDQFVRFAHANGLGHAGQIFEMLQTDRALVAGDANGGTSGTGHGMRAQAKRLNHADDAGDFRFRGIGIHDDEHKRASFFLCNGARCKPVSRCLHIRVSQFMTAFLHSHLNFRVSATQQFDQRVDLMWRSNWIEPPAADQDGTIF